MRPITVRTVRTLVALVVVAFLAVSCSDSDDSSPDDGSVDGARCVGTPAPCESFTRAEPCGLQGGCYWVEMYGQCYNCFPTGPTACEILSGRQDVCLGQVGCSWVE
jgi:hypothetical protein